MTRLALLWHLHQPDYRDPITGRPLMPWVRLHALRGYRDLFLESVEHDLSVTINVVPTLLDQLEWYAQGGDDPHLALTGVPSDALSADQAHEVCHALPAGHPAMTEALPAYASLRSRVAEGHRPSTGELRDLQVWATLAWFGATAHRDFPELGALCARPGGFTEGDKGEVLAIADQVVRQLPDQLRAVAQAGGPRLSTTPLTHPILPLIIDARHALRSMPDLPDEVDFAWPQDALQQLVMARERVLAHTGVAPVGLWPSEGSVSPEVVPLAAEAGFRWLASDVGVLERSVRSATGRGGGWGLGHGITGFFRDTELSDRVGFRYATRDPRDGAHDLLRGVVERGADGLVVVALDGENPWESYRDAGGAFRAALYAAIRASDVVPMTLDEAADAPVVGTVERLHTGSWIGADFHIWIGHPDDRAAWSQLAAARTAAEGAPPEARRRAMPHLFAAEGSDWTWWYGDDFRTPWAPTFDALFRAHLAAAWRALSLEPPASLSDPIGSIAPDAIPPQRFLEVHDHGESWLAWLGAGHLLAPEAAMAAGHTVHRLRYGWERGVHGGPGALWMRASVRGSGWRAELEPSDEVSERWVDGDLVVRAGTGRATVQFVAEDGSRWPLRPVVLHPPGPDEVAWWEV